MPRSTIIRAAARLKLYSIVNTQLLLASANLTVLSPPFKACSPFFLLLEYRQPTGLGHRRSSPFRGRLWMRSGEGINLSNCQTNRPRGAFLAPKYGWDDREGPSRAIRKIHIVALSALSLSFYSIFLFIRFLPSVFFFRRTQFHTCGIMLLWSLKNENRWLFSYGRTTTTVRTRRYSGADASVRNQSQVLSTVKMGSEYGFSALEKV